MKYQSISVCDLLTKIVNNNTNDKISIKELMDSFGNGGFYIFILIFSLILVIPTPQPIAFICGLLIIFFFNSNAYWI